jgi:hypothetical protein
MRSTLALPWLLILGALLTACDGAQPIGTAREVFVNLSETPLATPGTPSPTSVVRVVVGIWVGTPLATPGTPSPTSTPAFWPTGMPRPTAGPTVVLGPADRSMSECLKRGGTWFDQVPPGGAGPCQHYRTTDGGRICSNGRECEEGWCDANLPVEVAEELLKRAGNEPVLMTGTCFPERLWCGDHSIVDGGALTVIKTVCM